MLWLPAQIWVWLVVAVALGVLAGWWFLARPLHREIARRESPHREGTGHAGGPRP